MSDLISRQATIDALEAKKDKTAKGTIGQFYNTIIQHDIDALIDLPTIDAVEVKHGEWVSVKDRLPEDGQEVLVYAVGKADGFIGDNVIALSERFMFRLFPAWNGVGQWKSPWEYFDSNYEITHWMPLPEPPKGAER